MPLWLILLWFAMVEVLVTTYNQMENINLSQLCVPLICHHSITLEFVFLPFVGSFGKFILSLKYSAGGWHHDYFLSVSSWFRPFSTCVLSILLSCSHRCIGPVVRRLHWEQQTMPEAPGFIGSGLGLVCLVSMHCNWVREQVWSAASVYGGSAHNNLFLNYSSMLLGR